LVVLYLAFTTTKEGSFCSSAASCASGGSVARAPEVETSGSLYALGGSWGADAVCCVRGLCAGHCVRLDVRDALSLLVNAVIAREVARIRHVGTLMTELAAKERLRRSAR